MKIILAAASNPVCTKNHEKHCRSNASHVSQGEEASGLTLCITSPLKNIWTISSTLLVCFVLPMSSGLLPGDRSWHVQLVRGSRVAVCWCERKKTEGRVTQLRDGLMCSSFSHTASGHPSPLPPCSSSLPIPRFTQDRTPCSFSGQHNGGMVRSAQSDTQTLCAGPQSVWLTGVR